MVLFLVIASPIYFVLLLHVFCVEVSLPGSDLRNEKEDFLGVFPDQSKINKQDTLNLFIFSIIYSTKCFLAAITNVFADCIMAL